MYLTPSCTILLWLTKFFLCDTWWPQILQLYFSLLSWILLLCIFILLLYIKPSTGKSDRWICLSYQCCWWTDHTITYLVIIVTKMISIIVYSSTLGPLHGYLAAEFYKTSKIEKKTWFRARFLEISAYKSTGNLILTYYLTLWISKIGPMVPKLDDFLSAIRGAFIIKTGKV